MHRSGGGDGVMSHEVVKVHAPADLQTNDFKELVRMCWNAVARIAEVVVEGVDVPEELVIGIESRAGGKQTVAADLALREILNVPGVFGKEGNHLATSVFESIQRRTCSYPHNYGSYE